MLMPASTGSSTGTGLISCSHHPWQATTTWDQDKVYGCVCDSTWAVGFRSGETQVPLWFGADCSKSKCCGKVVLTASGSQIQSTSSSSCCFSESRFSEAASSSGCSASLSAP
jgi:hypothetical protein